VEAVFEELIETHGLLGGNSTLPETTLVFGGASAGGRGAMFHLDNLRSRLENRANETSSAVRMVGVLDSPFWFFCAFVCQKYQPLYPEELVPLQNQTDSIRLLANVSDLKVLDSECAASYAEGELWKCLNGTYRMNFLTTRYLLIASSYDSFQLGQVSSSSRKPRSQAPS